MDTFISLQSTPNPNAFKFVLNRKVKTEGKIGYKNAEECHTNPLARKLFSIPGISEIFFFDNVITVTHDGREDWDVIEPQVRQVIEQAIGTHDPSFKAEKDDPNAARAAGGELAKIEAIFDRTIRPALQADGGELLIMSLQNNVLTISYQGACGSCPSATMGTLQAIENILQQEYNPNIVVQAF